MTRSAKVRYWRVVVLQSMLHGGFRHAGFRNTDGETLKLVVSVILISNTPMRLLGRTRVFCGNVRPPLITLDQVCQLIAHTADSSCIVRTHVSSQPIRVIRFVLMWHSRTSTTQTFSCRRGELFQLQWTHVRPVDLCI